MPQLVLNINLCDDATFDNFYMGENTQLIAALKMLVQSQDKSRVTMGPTIGPTMGISLIYLWSEQPQLGKTHLLQACCHLARDQGLNVLYLPLTDIKQFDDKIFDHLENLQLICLDDLQSIAGLSLWEHALFHLYNRSDNTGINLLIAANKSPQALGIQLPDLQSRLSGGMIFQVQVLSHIQKQQALMMRANRRGFKLPKRVTSFLINRYPRNMGSLLSVLDHLDKASLQHKRKITIPWVKQVLEMDTK